MTDAPSPRCSSGSVRPDDVRAAIDNLGYDLKLREFAPRTEIGIRNFNERCEELAAALSRTPPAGNTLESLVREYARDLRRNSSGGDLSPDELRNNESLADYLEELIRRSGGVAQPPTNRELHDAIAEAISNGRTYSGIQDAVRAIQKLYASSVPSTNSCSAATKHSGTFLGYRDEHGNEMHCAHAFCPHQAKCRKGCINPVAVTSTDGK